MDSGGDDNRTTTTPTNQPTRTASTTTTTDDESSSLTTSTESELLGTWTLVTDKAKQKLDDEAAQERERGEQKRELAHELTQAINEAATQRVEELHATQEADDGVFEEEDTKETRADSTMDDLSDGISIISESDSGGRISPHPFLRVHLQDMDRFQLNEESPAPKLPIVVDDETVGAELRQRRRKRSSSRSKTLQDADEDQALQPKAPVATAVAESRGLPRFVRHGLSGIFYVGVAVALLALYGKMRNPEWEPLSAAKQPMAELQQKVIDMELQNNLMRAEIDILSRQVNYLSNAKQHSGGVAPPPQGQKGREDKSRPKGRQFKAWPGNGERLEPVDINKGDLKRPYKCPNGHVEIAGMCVENAPDTLANTVEDVLASLRDEQPETVEAATPIEDARKEEEPPAFAQPPQQEGRSRFGEPRHQRDFKHHNSKERFHNNNNNKENRYPKHGSGDGAGNSKEQYRKRFKADEDSRESGERFQRDSREKRRDSKEQWRKAPPHPKGGPERHPKGSGEWHEKLMQQREFSRRQHEQKRNDKNWYIERGSSREHMRYS